MSVLNLDRSLLNPTQHASERDAFLIPVSWPWPGPLALTPRSTLDTMRHTKERIDPPAAGAEPSGTAGPLALLCALCVLSAPALASPANANDAVAVLETRAPILDEFVLRGTIPVPPRTFPRPDGRAPLTVLDWDGTPLVTQTEIVSRYARESDGADVVEVIARVRRDPAITAGTPLRYTVVRGGPFMDPEETTQGLPESVLALLRDPAAIEIATYDCFGNKYISRPLNGAGTARFVRKGPVHTELRVYQDMVPRFRVDGPTGTLPHFFGVHAYISAFQGSQNLGLDLRFHNGHDGHDDDSALDDPLGRVYFDRIEITLPAGWSIEQDFPDPFFGSTRTANGRRTIELVGPNPNGRLHVMRWQGQFHRRLMISPAAGNAAAAAATAQLAGAGRAFCVRGSDPIDGEAYWSWWNRDTARYFPQRQQLPLLDHVARAAMDAELVEQQKTITELLEEGGDQGIYPYEASVLGWAHPYGVAYGGMTGGVEINLYEGITTAETASKRGYRYYSALHRMTTDRMPTALYSIEGKPSSVEEWLIDVPGGSDYVPFQHFLLPFLGSSYPDPFGVRQAPTFQVDHVQAAGLQPYYETRYLQFEPYDFQHYVRYTRAAKVLAWLGNDSVAKDDLRQAAETFHLSFHHYYNDPAWGSQMAGMRSMMNAVQARPGQGCTFGRGEAWGTDCMVAAYAVADPAWRASKRPWFEELTELLLAGQGSCTGFIQSFVSDKAVGGRYRARQQIEQSITEHALVGLLETVFRFEDPPHAAMVRTVLEGSLRSFISEMAWFPNASGPWRYTGIGPLGSQPMWCDRDQMPPDAWTAGDVETYQDWSSFAYGYELTGDPSFLAFARRQFPGLTTSLHVKLEADGLDNLQNRAALLALVQRLHGEL